MHHNVQCSLFPKVAVLPLLALILMACESDESTQAANKTEDSLVFEGVSFKPNQSWKETGMVKLVESGRSFSADDGQGFLVNFKGDDQEAKPTDLMTSKEYKDVHVSMEVNITEASNSGIILQGRYKISINNIFGKKRWWPNWMGGLASRWDEEREWKEYDGAKALANPSKRPGEWQKIDIDFKAPRFDKDGLKTEYATFINVKLNGVTVQENQIATGPSRFPLLENEVEQGPLIIMGSGGPIAIRNLVIEERDYSDVAAVKPVDEKHKVPLGSRDGRPMLNLVEIGDKAFHAYGCKECHEVKPDSVAVKTGPSLYGVFSPKPQTLPAFDSKTQEINALLMDENYFNLALREPAKHLAIRQQTNGNDKQFLPIMPAFSEEMLSSKDAKAILAYLHSLNPEATKGPDYVWQQAPEKPYVLAEDKSAELIGQHPRISRVNISDLTSGRAYHVGLPNHMNYTFDPRTLAVELVWSGRYLSLKNEKRGRADAPSEVGKGAKVWKSNLLSHLFQPKLKGGERVDFHLKEPTRVNAQLSREFLNSKSDFMSDVAKIDAEFLGVDTPYGEIATFHYRVNDNQVSMQLNIDQENHLSARFDFINASELSLYVGGTDLGDVAVSVGEIKDGYWHVQKGEHKDVSFSAKLEKASKFESMEDPEFTQNNDPQPLMWSDSLSKKKILPKGYALQDGSMPKDKFGRKPLFEPLGIAFNDEGEAFVSTRTAGVWKVKNSQWQQFAEGVFGSLGVVVESNNSVVIGEKPSLTRLVDEDGDGWAETRQVVSDAFRFNANYHEYLHGPVKTPSGGYMFALNLAHGIPGGYSGNGTMSSIGGYRGWAMEVDAKGNTHPYAHGLRSPAGIGAHKDGAIYYTDNQGDYHGTSKLYKLKSGAYYGHPAGLVDMPNMNVNSPEISFNSFKSKRDIPVGLLPHAMAMNSPGSPIWDESASQFGPYQGQMYIGDQTQSNIFRVHVETVDGIEQSSLLPFAKGLSSGAMRLTFDNKGSSMWIGQTGRGWGTRGGQISALQRIVWDGKTIPQSIHSISVHPKGYIVRFTQPIAESDRASFDNVKLSSWYYSETNAYGSEELGIRDEAVSRHSWSADGKALSFDVENFVVDDDRAPELTTRLYQIDLGETAFARGLEEFHTKAWYTLNTVPKAN